MLHFRKIPKTIGQHLVKFRKIQKNLQILFQKSEQISAIFNAKIEIRERCKGVSPWFFSAFVLSFHFLLFNNFFSSGDSIQVHCVDLGESFPTSLYLQNLVSIQQRTSSLTFAKREFASKTIELDST